jgi:hypothetical protein
MESTTGWVLDVTIEQNRAILWIKIIDGPILRLIDNYQPSFYVLPKNEHTGDELFQILSQQPKIKKVDGRVNSLIYLIMTVRNKKADLCLSRIGVLL